MLNISTGPRHPPMEAPNRHKSWGSRATEEDRSMSPGEPRRSPHWHRLHTRQHGPRAPRCGPPRLAASIPRVPCYQPRPLSRTELRTTWLRSPRMRRSHSLANSIASVPSIRDRYSHLYRLYHPSKYSNIPNHRDYLPLHKTPSHRDR